MELPGLRPQVLALSPDGKILATSGKTNKLIIVNPATGTILQKVTIPSDTSDAPRAAAETILKPDKHAQASYTGLIFSPDGTRIYLSNVGGSIKVFGVGEDHMVKGIGSLPLPQPDAERKKDIPAGLAISPDGTKLYVVLNFSNQLLEMDATTGKVLRLFDVGNVPYAVALVGDKAFVSNWGGRRPDAHSITGPIGVDATVRVDPVRFIANEGSVSVIDLADGKTTQEIMTGLHSSGLALSPDKHYLAVANANSDSVTIIDTSSDKIAETISLSWHQGDLFGASPNALVFDPSGKTLYVCNGTQNAVAVVSFQPGKSKIVGLIPTGWYPGAIVSDQKRKALYVANIKGIGSGHKLAPGEKPKFNSHEFFGTLSLIPIPRAKQLAAQTQVVLENYRRSVVESANLPARVEAKPIPVPERTGEPSLFKHVIYIIKENRTYDQNFGDMKEGNGDSSLCMFGQEITPNLHKIARDFVLLDNICCSGVLSADGHQWTDSGFATDYMEKSFAGFPRSYPAGGQATECDALAYSPAGFIWDNAIAHGKTLRVYGEFTSGSAGWKDAEKTPKPTFADYYHDIVNHTDLTWVKSTGVGSLAHALHEHQHHRLGFGCARPGSRRTFHRRTSPIRARRGRCPI